MKENKAFGTLDALILVVVLGAFLTLFKAFGLSSGPQKEVSRAEFEARQIGLQLLSGGLRNPEFNSDFSLERGPSSDGSAQNGEIFSLGREGLISRDPWGRPFNYRIFNGPDGESVALVWSRGPNGERDTTDESIVFNEQGRFIAVSFHENDVGVVVRSSVQRASSGF